MNNQRFLSENFQFFKVKYSVYLNRHIFVMAMRIRVFGHIHTAKAQISLSIPQYNRDRHLSLTELLEIIIIIIIIIIKKKKKIGE